MRSRLFASLLLGGFFMGCQSEQLDPLEDPPSGSDSPGATQSGPSTGTPSSAGPGGGGSIDPPPTEPNALRVIVLGDAGYGNTSQLKVAEAIASVCESHDGCHLALYLGDNIYPSGVTSVSDEQLQTKFEDMYFELPFPFYVVLGNHDYGGGLDMTRAQAQVDYTGFSDKWSMPERYYAFSSPIPDVDAAFFMMDTQNLLMTGDVEQADWIHQEVQNSTATWKIVSGHHPYLSNGFHGNAGAYDGVQGGGDVLKTIVDTSLCDRIDLHLSGHDHNRQWFPPTCGVEFIVSGAGASVRSLPGKNPPLFQDEDRMGFLLLQLTNERLVGTFYDEDALPQFTRTIVK